MFRRIRCREQNEDDDLHADPNTNTDADTAAKTGELIERDLDIDTDVVLRYGMVIGNVGLPRARTIPIISSIPSIPDPIRMQATSNVNTSYYYGVPNIYLLVSSSIRILIANSLSDIFIGESI